VRVDFSCIWLEHGRPGLEMEVIYATTLKSPTISGRAFELTGQLPGLPHTCACSTIGAERLNFRVRDGNGWDPLAMVTQNLLAVGSLLPDKRNLFRSLI
jgi:hypothetical protein